MYECVVVHYQVWCNNVYVIKIGMISTTFRRDIFNFFFYLCWYGSLKRGYIKIVLSHDLELVSRGQYINNWWPRDNELVATRYCHGLELIIAWEQLSNAWPQGTGVTLLTRSVISWPLVTNLFHAIINSWPWHSISLPRGSFMVATR